MWYILLRKLLMIFGIYDLVWIKYIENMSVDGIEFSHHFSLQYKNNTYIVQSVGRLTFRSISKTFIVNILTLRATLTNGYLEGKGTKNFVIRWA